MLARGLQALLPGLASRQRLLGGQQRLAQQLPGGRILGVELDAALQVFGGARRFAGIQVALAQAEAQQGVVHALGQHFFQGFEHKTSE
ncbi:hypothetical protein D3C86_2061050 [compost metagenome]